MGKGKKLLHEDGRFYFGIAVAILIGYLLISLYQGTHVSYSGEEIAQIREKLMSYGIEKSYGQLQEVTLGDGQKRSIQQAEPKIIEGMRVRQYVDDSYMVKNAKGEVLLFETCFDTNPTPLSEGFWKAAEENVSWLIILIGVDMVVAACFIRMKTTSEEKMGLHAILKEEREKK